MKGWKIVFKVCIMILRINEEALLAMSFEEMLKTLVRLPENYLIVRQVEFRKQYMDAPLDGQEEESKASDSKKADKVDDKNKAEGKCIDI